MRILEDKLAAKAKVSKYDNADFARYATGDKIAQLKIDQPEEYNYILLKTTINQIDPNSQIYMALITSLLTGISIDSPTDLLDHIFMTFSTDEIRRFMYIVALMVEGDKKRDEREKNEN